MDKEIEDRSKLIRKLEWVLEKYDKVFLVWNQEKAGEKEKLHRLIKVLCNSELTAYAEKKRLILFTEESEVAAVESFEAVKTVMPEESSVTYLRIAKEEAKFLYQLYHLYEFSDRFSVISRADMYGSLFNFLDAGLLSVKEAAEVLLH